jgi:dTDP-glucose 4,6-dehydratase
MLKYLVTGGCGFIGSNFIHMLLQKYGMDVEIYNLDKLTYAGNPENLKDIAAQSNYHFIHGDICDDVVVNDVMNKVDVVVNFAAETHVDRAISKPDDFIKTDIFGAFVLLESARKSIIKKFIQISTDEVYGSILNGSFKETDVLDPSSPYSASKAGADRLAYSYFVTYNLPVIISRCSNNYGPYQFPEKLIPLFITNALDDKKLPIYGDGRNVRDWIFVMDHCLAIDFLIQNGQNGQVYNIGAGEEQTNLQITKTILQALGKSEDLMTYVQDRPGHDRRYSVDTTKIRSLGWKPAHCFTDAMKETIHWYINNRWWWEKLKSGEYLKYYKEHYKREL